MILHKWTWNNKRIEKKIGTQLELGHRDERQRKCSKNIHNYVAWHRHVNNRFSFGLLRNPRGAEIGTRFQSLSYFGNVTFFNAARQTRKYRVKCCNLWRMFFIFLFSRWNTFFRLKVIDFNYNQILNCIKKYFRYFSWQKTKLFSKWVWVFK